MTQKPRVVFWSLVFSLVLVSSVCVYSTDQNCQILITFPQNELAILSQAGDGYEEIARLVGGEHILSSDRRYLAVEQTNASQLQGSVAIFDLASGTPTEMKIISDAALIRGSAWSPDSQQLLLQDADSNRFLYLYDLSSDNLLQLSTTFDPGLEVYQVAWNDQGSRVAFIAIESPFPRTEYANVTALYVLDLTTFDYSPISSATENVGWYFENFYWTSSAELAFTSCEIETDNCRITISNLQGEILASFPGNYWLERYNGVKTLFALNQDSLDVENSEMDLVAIDLATQQVTTVESLPVAPFESIPFFSISPDFSYISYVDAEGKTVIEELINSQVMNINDVANFEVGEWNPDSIQLLTQSENNLYIYEIKEDRSSLIFSADENTLIGKSWLCFSSEH